jgi:hypothetical protein
MEDEFLYCAIVAGLKSTLVKVDLNDVELRRTSNGPKKIGRGSREIGDDSPLIWTEVVNTTGSSIRS